MNSGHVLTSYTLGGTVIGALLAVALLPFAKYGRFEDLFAILTVAGHGLGWTFGFGKLLVERRRPQVGENHRSLGPFVLVRRSPNSRSR